MQADDITFKYINKVATYIRTSNTLKASKADNKTVPYAMDIYQNIYNTHKDVAVVSKGKMSRVHKIRGVQTTFAI